MKIRFRKAKKLNKRWNTKKLSGEKDIDGDMLVNQQDTGKERLSWESGVEEKFQDEEQGLEDKILFGEFRLMSRANKVDPEEETRSVAYSSIDDNRKNSEIDPYSNMNSSTGSEMLEIAIQTLLVEARARDLV